MANAPAQKPSTSAATKAAEEEVKKLNEEKTIDELDEKPKAEPKSASVEVTREQRLQAEVDDLRRQLADAKNMIASLTKNRKGAGLVPEREAAGEVKKYRLVAKFWDGQMLHKPGAILPFRENTQPSGSIEVK